MNQYEIDFKPFDGDESLLTCYHDGKEVADIESSKDFAERISWVVIWRDGDDTEHQRRYDTFEAAQDFVRRHGPTLNDRTW